MYCRRLSLQVPVAVSVKTGQTADVFHAICSVAMHPYVCKWPAAGCLADVPHVGILRFQEALREACRQRRGYGPTSCCRRLWEVFLRGFWLHIGHSFGQGHLEDSG